MEMEIFEDKMENVSGLNLTNIHREIIEEIKNQEEGIEIEIPHEYFDENYRGELWAKSVRMVEIRDKEESMSKLREIINVDKNLFDYFMTKNRSNIQEQVKEQILNDLTRNKEVRAQLEMHPEFIQYQESMLRVNQIFNKIINLFKMCDFYLSIKESQKAAKSKSKVKRAPWDMNLLVKKLGLKSLNLFMGLSKNFLDTALKGNKFWKSLISLSLITLLRSNPAAFALGLNLTYGTIVLPIAGKIIQWTGIFDKITNMISKEEMILYIQGLQKTCEETHRILRRYYELITKDFEDILNSSEDGLQDCETKLVEKLDIFNKNFSELEVFVENQILGELVQQDVGDGWMLLTEDAKDLSMTRHEGFDSVF